jgi:hypothetical protein
MFALNCASKKGLLALYFRSRLKGYSQKADSHQKYLKMNESFKKIIDEDPIFKQVKQKIFVSIRPNFFK